MARLPHYAEYAGGNEVAPGVFVDAGSAVYIVDDEGEVVSWTESEFDDPMTVTAVISAVALAAQLGSAAVRNNILDKGETLVRLIRLNENAVA